MAFLFISVCVTLSCVQVVLSPRSLSEVNQFQMIIHLLVWDIQHEVLQILIAWLMLQFTQMLFLSRFIVHGHST